MTMLHGHVHGASPVPRPARHLRQHRSAGRPAKRLAVAVRAEQVLIVNTKGGGHAFIGLHLAKQLLQKGHSVTIFNEGDQVSKSSFCFQ